MTASMDLGAALGAGRTTQQGSRGRSESAEADAGAFGALFDSAMSASAAAAIVTASSLGSASAGTTPVVAAGGGPSDAAAESAQSREAVDAATLPVAAGEDAPARDDAEAALLGTAWLGAFPFSTATAPAAAAAPASALAAAPLPANTATATLPAAVQAAVGVPSTAGNATSTGSESLMTAEGAAEHTAVSLRGVPVARTPSPTPTAAAAGQPATPATSQPATAAGQPAPITVPTGNPSGLKPAVGDAAPAVQGTSTSATNLAPALVVGPTTPAPAAAPHQRNAVPASRATVAVQAPAAAASASTAGPTVASTGTAPLGHPTPAIAGLPTAVAAAQTIAAEATATVQPQTATMRLAAAAGETFSLVAAAQGTSAGRAAGQPSLVPVPAAQDPAPALASAAVPAPLTVATTASAAGQPVPPAPQPGPALQPQLSRPLFTLAAAPAGEHVMTLQVSPEDLGPLTVRAHIDASGVRIEMFAPGEAGREAIRGVLPELRKELADAGFGASLNLSDRSGPQDSGQNGRAGFGAGRDGGSGPGNHAGTGDPRPRRGDGAPEPDRRPTGRPDSAQTNLDILV